VASQNNVEEDLKRKVCVSVICTEDLNSRINTGDSEGLVSLMGMILT